MFNLNIFFVVIHILISFSAGTKWLIDNPGFDDSKNWLNDYLPCARETVIFPEQYPGVLPLPKNVDVGGFVLPANGAILLNRESIITLSGESKKRSCDRGKAYIRSPQVHKWFDPKTWRSSDEKQSNKAMLALEKVPCNNESVVIQNKGPLAFDLENVPFLRMGQLNFAGSLLSKDYVRQLLYTNLGQLLFRNQAGVRVEYYHNDVCGCHRDYNHFLEPICHNVMKSCEKPHCQVSITPLGSCCSICGSLLSFKVDNCGSRRLHTLQAILEKAVKEQNLQNDLDYHVNYYSSKDYGIYLQAIIVDRKNYNEKSVNFVKSLNNSVNWLKKLNLQSLTLANYKLQYSGRPYNPDITFGSVVLIILCIVLCAIVALIIFAHYVPNHRYLLYIPQWMYDPRRWMSYNWRNLLYRSNFMFARFDNTRSSIRDVPNVTRTPVVMGYDAENERVRERSFDNPMFNEEPTAVAKKTTVEKNEQLTGQSAAKVNDKDETKRKDEQELTEIKLISSSEEEDTEEETIE
uniref:Protein amnionless n=1 Tax=Glossina brevipalpis TaxID=37001 RepID=A0A1A9WK82_9MUSC